MTYRCHRCDTVIPEAHGAPQGALCITFSGYGDAGFIDTYMHDDPSIVLCATCASDLRAARPELAAIDRFLNINYSHVCEAQEGRFIPAPLPSCQADPDQHGWRKVFAVRPASRTPRGELWYVCDSAEEAELVAAACDAAGHPARVTSELVGNLSFYGPPTEPLGARA
jgi:hypothetical protein